MRVIRRRIAVLGGLWIVCLLCLPALRSCPPRMMERLADLYWEEGKASQSTRLYKRLIAADMTSPRVCGWQSKVLRNSLSLAGYDKQRAAEELERLGLIYDRARPTTPEQAPECRNAFHDSARKLAFAWHREGQQAQDNGTLALADRAYQLFLAHFADDQDAYEVNFFWGERLWVLGRWKDAAGQYTRVVEARPGGQFARESAYAAMLAWKNVHISEDYRLCQGPRDRGRFSRDEDCGTPAAEPIPEAQQKLIGAIHTYAKMVPDTPEMPVLLYHEACIYYDHGQFDRAEPLFLEVVQKHTKHELAVSSANMYLDALVRECKSKEVLAAARQFLDTPDLMRDAPSAQHMIPLFTDADDL